MPAAAENWIRIRESLLTDPRIDHMAEILGETTFGDMLAAALHATLRSALRNTLRSVAIVGLQRVWFAANRHTAAGVFTHATLHYIDDIAQVPGFAKVMEAVGWAEWDAAAATFTLPDFTNWNTPAKSEGRAKSTLRANKSRALKALAALTPDQSAQVPALVAKARAAGASRSDLCNAAATLHATLRSALELELEIESTEPTPQPQSARDAALLSPPGFGTPPDDWPKTPEAARAMAGEIGVHPDDVEAIWAEHESRGDYSETDTHGRAFRIQKARQYFRSRGMRAGDRRRERDRTTTPPGFGRGASPEDRERQARRCWAQREEAKKEIAELRKKSFDDDGARERAAHRIKELDARVEKLTAQLAKLEPEPLAQHD